MSNLLKNTSFVFLKDITYFWLISIACILTYIYFSEYWVPLGKGEERFSSLLFYVELPLILLFSACWFFPSINNRYIRFLLPILPIIILYLLVDGFYNYYATLPRLTDFQNFLAIFDFSASLGVALIVILLLLPACIACLIMLAKNSNSNFNLKRSLLRRSLFLSLLIILLNSPIFIDYHNKNFAYVVWSQEDTIRANGKFSSFIYYSNQEADYRKSLLNRPASQQNFKIFSGKVNRPKNIHIIVLESFVDPRLLRNSDEQPIHFESPILAKELLPYLNNQQEFSKVISPIYGGGTAQAEFELLTGIKALAKVNRIEFNVMQGAPTTSLVNQLNDNHYTTMATVASSNAFFNSQQAYASIGFQKVTFLEDLAEFPESSRIGPIFDGDMFDYNLREFKRVRQSSNQPILNYSLGMYGHLPFARDTTRHPDIVNISHKDDRIQRISNQFYYRTKALARHITALLEIDPHSIIYVTGDHLPSILNEDNHYALDNKINMSLLLIDGVSVDVTGKSFYQLPWLFWNEISDQPVVANITDAQMEEFYFQLLAQSIQPVNANQNN